MTKKILLFLFFISLLTPSFARKIKPKVYFLPTIHGYHKINPRYSYDSLKAMIKRLHPDIIAVEIKPDDTDADSSYLKKNYPYEMWIMKYWFPTTEIRGFDWLGKDLEGKKIPAGYWKNESPAKKLERVLAADSVYSAKTDKCNPRYSERDSIMKHFSLNEILKSKDDNAIVKSFYKCLEETLKISPYEALPAFYAERNRQILENIRDLIRKNSSKTIVILTGDDHYQLLKDQIITRPE